MKRFKLDIVERRLLKNLLESGVKLSAEGEHLSVGATLQLIRKSLHMTQVQLAKRSGIAQTSIAKIESDKINVSLETLERLFAALYCRIALMPIPVTHPGAIVESQAAKLAKTRADYLKGTLALEDQVPDAEVLNTLLEDDLRNLIDTGSSEIWDV